MKKIFNRVSGAYREIPNKKPYIEFLAALLSIPVLLTVILLNVNNLRDDKKSTTQTTPVTEKIYVTVPSENKQTQIVSQGPCTPGIGQVNLASPDENEVVTDNPTLVNITYNKGDYCEVVWSYRINNGKWSDYDDKSIALYNLPKGNIKLDLRVKSIVSNDTEAMSRNFVYQGESIVPTSPVSSSSAN